MTTVQLVEYTGASAEVRVVFDGSKRTQNGKEVNVRLSDHE